VRWRRRRYHLVAFDGCAALVPTKRGRDAASLLRYSSGQLGTLDGGSRIVRDVEVADGTVHQDVAVYSAILEPGESVEHAVAAGRHAWVHVARGAATVNGEALAAGDGAALSDEWRVAIQASEPSEVWSSTWRDAEPSRRLPAGRPFPGPARMLDFDR
jgi:hypothetical protein